MSRPGKTRTLSISVDATTDKILKEEARASFDGNVSKLIAAMAREARRKGALERLAVWSGYSKLSERERDAIEAEIQKDLAGQRPKKRRSAA
ncbi:MAG: hypothetical protein SFX73_21085 [Kofleriaceae bacterium]|nr:hypothetical protein [Kofleriaceae bacterium]